MVVILTPFERKNMSNTQATVTEELVFIGSVVEKSEKRHPGSGTLEAINRTPVIKNAFITAVDATMAMVELIALAKEAKKDLDTKMLETSLVPFRADNG